MKCVTGIITFYALTACLVNAAIIGSSVAVPRISDGEQLLSSIATDCFNFEFVSCVNSRVISFLNSFTGLPAEESRKLEASSLDETIYRKLQHIVSANEFNIELPKSVFHGTAVHFDSKDGFTIELPRDEGRGILLKKKLLLPVLLLLKLKMKALMPIFVALIGLKAMKALILSKIAIKLVLGFLIYQLIQKLTGMKMSMAPMTPIPSTESPMSAYGAPVSTSASSYEPSWDQNGGPYARIWEPVGSVVSNNMAYSAYHPNTSGYSKSSSLSASSSLSSSSLR